MLGYCAFFSPFKPNMYYTLRLWRPDEFHVRYRSPRTACSFAADIDIVVLKVLHDVAFSARVKNPYQDACILYPDLEDWLPLE
eukprot:scaffold248883_cov43-Prasinocladus_malaysianus.AAC.1